MRLGSAGSPAAFPRTAAVPVGLIVRARAPAVPTCYEPTAERAPGRLPCQITRPWPPAPSTQKCRAPRAAALLTFVGPPASVASISGGVIGKVCVYRVLVRYHTYGKRATPPAERRLPLARTSSGLPFATDGRAAMSASKGRHSQHTGGEHLCWSSGGGCDPERPITPHTHLFERA